jgi:hypothetical protein
MDEQLHRAPEFSLATRLISWLGAAFCVASAVVMDWESRPWMGVGALAIAGILAITSRKRWTTSSWGLWLMGLLAIVLVAATIVSFSRAD